MKSPGEMNIAFSQNSFVISPGLLYHLVRHDTGGLANGLYVKSYCIFETIAQRFKNYKLYSLGWIRDNLTHTLPTIILPVRAKLTW